MKKFIPVVTILVIGIILIFTHRSRTALAPTETGSSGPKPTQNASSTLSILDASRISKKFFGTYVTPQNSPVQPERFTGYHTGVDFETTPAEANIDVPVPAFCDGKLLMKKYATGYGGVAVESCTLGLPAQAGGQAVTVIYGHLKLASIAPVVGGQLKKGDTLGILGKGYSTETDGERKHLHLGIHLGTAINILGYVQTKPALSAWLDPMQFLK